MKATVRKRARGGGKWRPITSVKEKTGVAGGYQRSEDSRQSHVRGHK